MDPPPASLSSLDSFIPALHYALFKLRSNPGKDVSSGVERHAAEYLARMETATVRPFILPEYKCSMDERSSPLPAPRPKFNMESVLRTYVHNGPSFMLPLNKARDIVERIQNPPLQPAPAPVEYSPVSDWGGSDRGSDRPERLPERPPAERPPPVAPQERTPTAQEGARRRAAPAHANGAQMPPKPQREAQPQPQPQPEAQTQPQPSQTPQTEAPQAQPPQSQPPRLRLSQNEYDKDKMKQLLKLIQLHKKALVKDPKKERAEDGAWDGNNLKRKFEGEDAQEANKHQRTESLSNGEPSRGEEQSCSSQSTQKRIDESIKTLWSLKMSLRN